MKCERFLPIWCAVRSPLPGERGAVTAEMMIGLPVVTAVMGVALMGLHAGLMHYRLEDQVWQQARAASLGLEVPGVTVEGDLLCVEDEYTLEKGIWTWSPLSLRARSCALNPNATALDEP